MSLEVPPTLGSKPVSIKVNLGKLDEKDSLAELLRDMYQKAEFCDVHLLCGEQTFPCHRVVLACRSAIFKEGLAQAPLPPAGEAPVHQVRLVEVANPEAVRFMLDFIYEMDATVWKDYNPATQEINKDVLRLAQRFQLPGLTQRATHWLAKDITTGNAVERLAICSEFGLNQLREKIIEQLTMNQTALMEVAHSQQIIKYPELMQALLKQAAAIGMEEEPSAKRQRVGGKGANGARGGR